MAIAIEGAIIVRDHEGPYTNQITYRRRCDACEYVDSAPPITVRCLPYDTVMHGCYHADSFVCPFCGNRQAVKIEG